MPSTSRRIPRGATDGWSSVLIMPLKLITRRRALNGACRETALRGWESVRSKACVFSRNLPRAFDLSCLRDTRFATRRHEKGFDLDRALFAGLLARRLHARFRRERSRAVPAT